jgi:phosphoglycolate phosphatase
MPSYSLIIFDFGGTIADSFTWFVGALNKAAKIFDFREVALDEIETVRRYDHQQILRHFGIPKWKLPLINLYLRRLQADAINTIPLFPGIDRTLRDLADAGMTLAIVSTNSKANVVRALGAETAALISHFGCGFSLFGKESKFKAVLSKSGVAPQCAIAIGDEIRDLQAARATNIAAGAVAWGYADFSTLLTHSPTRSFVSVSHMRATLLAGEQEDAKPAQ